jgi:thiol:disulfide interchange protein DsbC
MKKILEERKDIVFFIKLYPLKMHPAAYDKAKAIVCEKSLALLEDAFQNKSLPKPSCDTKVVDETIVLAEKQLGITGTPASIMPDGRIIPGALDSKKLIESITK